MLGKLRLLVVAVVIGVITLGVPTHVIATPVPKALDLRSSIATVIEPGATVRDTIVLPWRANMIGVSFDGPDRSASGVSIAVTALDGPHRGATYHLGVESGVSPDAAELARASTRIATQPEWIGHAKRLEVAVALSPDARAIRDVRLESINTVGDAHDRSLPARALGAIGRFLTAKAEPPVAARAATTEPAFITRAQWGADESWRTPGPGIATYVALAFVHHTDNSNSYSKSESPALVRGIYRYHTKTLGYSDIAYNFLVDRYGQVFEGRFGGVEKAIIGGHTGGFNTGSTGVALIGNFVSARPPSAMIGALERLLAWKLDVHHIPAIGTVRRISGGNERFPKGTARIFNRISGHRDASSTACPGAEAYKLLPAIRNAVDAMGQPKIYFPTVSPSPLRLTGIHLNSPLTMSATFSRSVSYALRLRDGDGTVVKEWTGVGSSFSRSWDGRMPGGSFIPTGTYAWTLTAAITGATARPASDALPISSDFTPPFYDDDGDIHADNINRVANAGITGGCGGGRYCPFGIVTRQQVAAFLTRLLDLGPAHHDYFADDEGSPFEDDINRVAEAGITTGCSADEFCPMRPVTRAEMAALLKRGLNLPPSVIDHFSDDNGSPFEPSINSIADAQITGGCGDGRYCPDDPVLRDQMASYLARAMDLHPASSPSP